MEYWKKVNGDGKITTVEGHSYPHEVPGAVRITKKEYDEFIATISIPEPRVVRDLEAEIDELRAEIGELRNPNR